MNRTQLEHTIPDTSEIKAVVVYQLVEGGQHIIVAMFLSITDAKEFAAKVAPKAGIGTYLAMIIED